MKRKALYAGSFDPITLGHTSIIAQAVRTFDEVHIAIGTNSRKTRLFSIEESLKLIRKSLEGYSVEIGSFEGKALDDYAREIGANHIVRGLRQVSDFNDEFALNGAIQHMDEQVPPLTMTYFICPERFLHVSSSMARELASLNKPLEWMVCPTVEAALREKFA